VSDFATSYLGRLRASVGDRLLLVPGARVVVEDSEGRLLLELRSDFGKWGLPGGVPDEHEDIVTCAVRETLEETGLQVRDLVPFGFASAPSSEVWTYPNGHVCHYFSMMFATRSFSGEPSSDGSENLKVRWFKPHDLPEVLPTVALTIDAFLRWKATGAFQMI
jgi:8-oxo-dGTP pyrophosphatase MutT (NUDIX family)